MRIGDIVETIEGYRGRIIDLYKNVRGDRVAIIEHDNERVTKALESDLKLIEDEPEETKETDLENFLDKEFTITPREFSEIVGEVSAKESKGDFKLVLSFSLFGAKLGIKMFDKGKND